MDDADVYRFDLQGFVTLRGVMSAEECAAANAVPELGDDEPEIDDAVVLPPRRDRRASAAEVLSKEAQRQLEWAMAE